MFNRIIVTILLVLVATGFVYGQRVRAGDTPAWPPANGISRFTLHQPENYAPRSLEALSAQSPLIALATVQQTIVRVLDHRLETDVVVRLDRVLRGPAGLKTVVVSQRGGVLGGYQELPLQFDLMKPGEQYFLFATEDKRTNMPMVSGSPRYWITGEWTGNPHIETQGIRFQSTAPGELRGRYEGMDLNHFLAEVTAVLNK